ncbi:MAG: Ig-like domain-containing protein, partial [Vicinamibacterales bacterium]
TDAAGNASEPGTLAVGVDQTAPAAPTGTVGQTGTVSGTAEAGSTVTLSVGGAAVATAVADAAGAFRMPQALASGATGTLTAADPAGNVSTGVDVTAPTYTVGTGGNDTVVDGGANTAFVGGGAGDDVLVGGNGGSVLNYQFDYWNATPDAIIFNSVGNFVTFSADANNGWAIGTTPGTYVADPLATAVTQFTGGVDPVVSGMQVQSNALTTGTEDDTGGGGRYYWDTVRNTDSGGSTISQNVLTAAGAQYTLSIQESDADQNTSLEVWWDGALLSQYDSITNTWTNPPAIDTLGASGRQTLSWQVTASGESSALEIRAFSAVPDDGVGMSIDRVTLDPVAPDGAETLAGGQGADILFGQEGDDTLYGGDVGQAAGPDAAADAFVYSMRVDNGNDVVMDFEVGLDRIYLTDALDTYTVGSAIPGTALSSDENLTFQDFLLGDSASQYLTVSDSEGSVLISFTGQDATGAPAAMGSVLLEGVAYGTEAGQFDTVEDLFTSGIVYATMNGFDPVQLAAQPPIV